jgi:hypothetical protein
MHSRAEVLEVMLLEDLYEAGWNGLPMQYPEANPSQVAMSSLAKSLLKKFHNDQTDKRRDDLALALFIECNERCRSYPGVQPRRLDEEYIIGEMKTWLWNFFNPATSYDNGISSREPFLLNLSDIATHFGFGAGSNIGASDTDFYSKLVLSSMSHTDPSLPILFRHAISIDKLWADLEFNRSARYGYEIVRGNRLSFVPKSKDISRTICTEPLLNMLFQKGIAGVLNGRLAEVTGIDFTLQPDRNIALARAGSEDGRYGTIDLSSASDTVSLTLLRDLLPREPLNWLLRCRSPLTVLPNGEELELHMISSMGNGFTFPLQTIIFTALVLAVYKIYGIKVERPRHSKYIGSGSVGNFAVFGDDIVVERRVYDTVVRMLGLLGFTVNENKSFNQGHFRESCGADFWSGYNVRGVYIKTLRDDMDSYSAINRLNRWSARHGILLRRAVSYLRAGCRFIGVPYDEADDAGIKIPLSVLRKPRSDANGAIHYLACVSPDRKLRVPSVDADRELSEIELGKIRRISPSFVYDSSALLFGLLAGHLRTNLKEPFGSFGLRSVGRKVVHRRRRCPGWDNRIFAAGESQSYASAWECAVVSNLVSSS